MWYRFCVFIILFGLLLFNSFLLKGFVKVNYNDQKIKKSCTLLYHNKSRKLRPFKTEVTLTIKIKKIFIITCKLNSTSIMCDPIINLLEVIIKSIGLQ